MYMTFLFEPPLCGTTMIYDTLPGAVPSLFEALGPAVLDSPIQASTSPSTLPSVRSLVFFPTTWAFLRIGTSLFDALPSWRTTRLTPFLFKPHALGFVCWREANGLILTYFSWMVLILWSYWARSFFLSGDFHLPSAPDILSVLSYRSFILCFCSFISGLSLCFWFLDDLHLKITYRYTFSSSLSFAYFLELFPKTQIWSFFREKTLSWVLFLPLPEVALAFLSFRTFSIRSPRGFCWGPSNSLIRDQPYQLSLWSSLSWFSPFWILRLLKSLLI